LGFISKNYEEIYSNPHQRGWLFEDFVEKELIERQAVIVKRNFETPKGEIDFICTKGERIFVIEAKDYGPWFDSDYISSRTYSERINAINERLTKAPPRLKWIELNRKPLGLSMSKKIQGLVITRLHEPHLKIPVGFEYVNVDELDLIFGKSKKAKSQVIKRKFRFGKESLLELEKELLNENEKAYMQFGLR
jgi:Holliday junction resolvase-like predicted endonuclease